MTTSTSGAWRSEHVDVWAAGAIVWRDDGDVAVVHRPRYDDWSVPQGKLEHGETMPFAAVREVAEESGLDVRLGPMLGDVPYAVPEGRKVVRYWSARVAKDNGFTADPMIGADLTDLFNSLTGYSRQTSYRSILVAPYGVRRGIVRRIEDEIEAHREGKADARVRMKVNSIVDEQVIDALYRASQAGVPVDIVVRGICAIRPGREGLSENIHVRSILGRFLEHSRVFHFGAADDYWIGSADMMHRNLDRRVEVLLRVADEPLAARLGAVLDSCLDPATRCWTLGPDGTLSPSPSPDSGVSPVRDHQAEMMLLRHAVPAAEAE